MLDLKYYQYTALVVEEDQAISEFWPCVGFMSWA